MKSSFALALVVVTVATVAPTPAAGDCIPDCINPRDYIPICGSDGRTHDNSCMMDFTSCMENIDITKLFDGPCPDSSSIPPATIPPTDEPDTDVLPADSSIQPFMILPTVEPDTDVLPADSSIQPFMILPTVEPDTDVLPADSSIQPFTILPAADAPDARKL
ncbi:protease inhibitor Epi10 [Phytophthora megakarya]|uniref:Protease inhibitor Epi10 n=1 Tax=Phytophthora megakarya TaxID=4795 RepID=A0A225WAR9_9STRA|nr:protease inhibitor Epi10 [Phytophthora megakarya]